MMRENTELDACYSGAAYTSDDENYTSVTPNLNYYSSSSSSVSDQSETSIPATVTILEEEKVVGPNSRASSVDVESKSKKQYTCSLCFKTFSRPSALQTHTYTHTSEKPFKCQSPGCGRCFSVVSNLRRHFKVHQKSSGGNKLSSEERINYVRELMRKSDIILAKRREAEEMNNKQDIQYEIVMEDQPHYIVPPANSILSNNQYKPTSRSNNKKFRYHQFPQLPDINVPEDTNSINRYELNKQVTNKFQASNSNHLHHKSNSSSSSSAYYKYNSYSSSASDLHSMSSNSSYTNSNNSMRPTESALIIPHYDIKSYLTSPPLDTRYHGWSSCFSSVSQYPHSRSNSNSNIQIDNQQSNTTSTINSNATPNTLASTGYGFSSSLN